MVAELKIARRRSVSTAIAHAAAYDSGQSSETSFRPPEAAQGKAGGLGHGLGPSGWPGAAEESQPDQASKPFHVASFDLSKGVTCRGGPPGCERLQL